MKFHHTSLLLMMTLGAAAPAQERPLRFQAELTGGQEFRRDIGHGLMFALRPDMDGWSIEVAPVAKSECSDFSGMIATPFRGYRQSDLSVAYGTTAAESVGITPREVDFVLTEADCKREEEWVQRLMWSYSYTAKQVQEAQDKFGKSPAGKAVLKILDSKVGPSGKLVEGKDLGRIEWIRFEVEIIFPKKP